MLTGTPFARPARPVADAPLEALSDTEELAKGWLLLLLAQAPLSAAAQVPAAELAREAPRLCGAMTASLSSDAELERLRPGGDLSPLAMRAGALAGAVDPAGAAAAVSALRGVIWSALLAAPGRPDPELVAALSARLALVADVVTVAALTAQAPAQAAAEAAAPATAPVVPAPASAGPSGDDAPAPGTGGREPVATQTDPEPAGPQDAAEPSGPQAVSEPSDPAPGPLALAQDWPEPGLADARPADTPATGVPDLAEPPDVAEPAAAVPPATERTQAPPAAQPAAKAPAPERVVPADVFPSVVATGGEDRSEPWATAVVRRLGRLVAEGVPCVVLAVDVDDAERLLAADSQGEAHAALDRIERALRDELRPGDAAVRERLGRVWVVAQAGGIEGARALGRRLAQAVASSGALHGTPLRAAIGIAACPDDGADPASLVAHADEGVFAARAAGVTIA